MSIFSRLWLACVAAFLLPFAYICLKPIEETPATPSFRGVGSPLLLVRRIIPEKLSRPVAIASIAVAGMLLAYLAVTSRILSAKRERERMLPYEREDERRRTHNKK